MPSAQKAMNLIIVLALILIGLIWFAAVDAWYVGDRLAALKILAIIVVLNVLLFMFIAYGDNKKK